MTKSETVNQFLELSKKMDTLLDNLRVDFKRECKAVLGTTQEQLERFDVCYSRDGKSVILFFMTTDDSKIKKIMMPPEDSAENSDEEKPEAYLCIVSKINFVTEIGEICDLNYYNEIMDNIIEGSNTKINKIEEEKFILIDKNNNFWFRLFHPRVDDAVDAMNLLIKEFDSIKSSAKKEKKFISMEYLKEIRKTFIEEVKHTYGIMDIPLKKEDIIGE